MRRFPVVLGALAWVAACGGAASPDGGTDGSVDATMDAGRRDAGPRDAGPRDLGSDAGECYPTLWPDGAAPTCDPALASDDPALFGADHCAPCEKCVDLGATDRTMPGGPRFTQCQPRCVPSAADNGSCADGKQCYPPTRTCTFGECTTDLDCQTYVEDTNHDLICDASAAGGDHVVVDPLANAHCNTATYRCERTGTAGATAGQHCMLDHECEANGHCLDQCQYSDFVGGYCTKDYCDLPGNACAAGGKCQDVGNGFHMCLRPCQVGNEAASLVLGAGGHGDTCDPGQACFYDDGSPPGTAANGGCLAGEYNAVMTNNVGHACTMSSECFSPHGLGQCRFRAPASACSIFGCAGFVDPDAECGAGNGCFAFAGGGSVCLKQCTTTADCTAAGAPATHVCTLFSPTATHSFCWPAARPTP